MPINSLYYLWHGLKGIENKKYIKNKNIKVYIY